MEIRNDPYDNRNRQASPKPLGADITLQNREAIERKTLEIATRQQDKVEVSRTSREVTDRVREARKEEDAERAERVRDLEAANRQGELNTDERIAQAAIRILESE